MENNHNSKTLVQLKKAEGMLKKVIKMSSEKRYCIDILQQNLAVIGLLKGVNKMILENHLHSCFKDGMAKAGGRKQNELIAELMRVISKA